MQACWRTPKTSKLSAFLASLACACPANEQTQAFHPQAALIAQLGVPTDLMTGVEPTPVPGAHAQAQDSGEQAAPSAPTATPDIFLPGVLPGRPPRAGLRLAVIMHRQAGLCRQVSVMQTHAMLL